MTRPSGSSNAKEWWSLGTLMAASRDHDSVAGSHVSASMTAPSALSKFEAILPPVTKTLPSGSNVAVSCWRGLFFGATDLQVGEATLRSMTSVHAVVGAR